MDYNTVLRPLLSYGVLISTMISCSDAITINFEFSVRQATYVAGGIAVLYIIFSIVILFILCRVSNCICCHKGKVCPRISPDIKIHKGKDFVEIDMESYTRKKSIMDSDGKTSKLGSIPEDMILGNPTFCEEDSGSENDSKNILHKELSVSTVITMVPGLIDCDDDRITSGSSVRSSEHLLRSLSEESQQETKLTLDNSGSSTPLLTEIAEQTGMQQWFGMRKEEPSFPSDQHGKEERRDKPIVKSANKTGSKLPNYSKRDRFSANAVSTKTTKNTLDLSSKHQNRKPANRVSELQTKTKPSTFGNPKLGSSKEVRTRSNNTTITSTVTSSGKSTNKVQLKHHPTSDGKTVNPYNTTSPQFVSGKNKSTPRNDHLDKSVVSKTDRNDVRTTSSRSTVSASSREKQPGRKGTSSQLAMTDDSGLRNNHIVVVEEEEMAYELSFI